MLRKQNFHIQGKNTPEYQVQEMNMLGRCLTSCYWQQHAGLDGVFLVGPSNAVLLFGLEIQSALGGNWTIPMWKFNFSINWKIHSLQSVLITHHSFAGIWGPSKCWERSLATLYKPFLSCIFILRCQLTRCLKWNKTHLREANGGSSWYIWWNSFHCPIPAKITLPNQICLDHSAD